MTKVSVIVPTYKDDEALVELLQKLTKMNIDEVIVADGEKRQELPPYIKQKSLPLTFIQTQKGRGPQIKAGIRIATYPILWILHADSRPHAKALKDIRLVLQNPEISLLKFTLKFDSSSWALKAFAWMARWDSPISSFGDQGFAFRRLDYDALTLNLDDYPLLEDVVLRAALRKLGRVKCSPLPIITSARRFEKYGLIKTQWLNVKTLWYYFRGRSPRILFETYYQVGRFKNNRT